jgi:hypothetical protein
VRQCAADRVADTRRAVLGQGSRIEEHAIVLDPCDERRCTEAQPERESRGAEGPGVERVAAMSSHD